MKFRVEVQRPILPPNHVPGAPLPERVALEVGEYVVDAVDHAAVVAQFDAAKASGLMHLQGRTIRRIEPVVNGVLFNGGES